MEVLTIDEKSCAIFTRKGLTVIVPAYNEVESISDTIHSLLDQTVPPSVILVVDDGSSDGTGDAARADGVQVLRPSQNTGSKAGAQNYALPFVETEFCMAIDADTMLAPDAIEHIHKAMADPEVAAACGFVLPRYCGTLWERGRYIEYMMSFGFQKRIQDFFERPLISSGCFSIYRTDDLRQQGGWSTRTMAEDMDLTWSFYAAGRKVRFVPEAVCYPIEPATFHFLSKQLTRWSHGLVQNVMLHWRDILCDRYLGVAVAVVMWDAIMATLSYLLVVPVLAITVSPLFLLIYLIDLPAIAAPALFEGFERRQVWRVMSSLPSFFILRVVNGWFLGAALVKECILGRRLKTYEKGH